jgi:siroheme synthase (precorrin-2 oxidase/ferrochelatase)
VNVVDNPALSSFISPAVFCREGMTVAVSSHGRDVKKAVKWRDRIGELFNNDQDQP